MRNDNDETHIILTADRCTNENEAGFQDVASSVVSQSGGAKTEEAKGNETAWYGKYCTWKSRINCPSDGSRRARSVLRSALKTGTRDEGREGKPWLKNAKAKFDGEGVDVACGEDKGNYRIGMRGGPERTEASHTAHGGTADRGNSAGRSASMNREVGESKRKYEDAAVENRDSTQRGGPRDRMKKVGVAKTENIPGRRNGCIIRENATRQQEVGAAARQARLWVLSLKW
ncbi:hypothetical protein C8R45DRAFT_937247 [Mycena sanguinolenta]|nr:hypothetical protein C8R45DRAFT_937247 [Mycena sanguinolenta]